MSRPTRSLHAILLIIAVSSTSVRATSIGLGAVHDTFVRAAEPQRNFGAAGALAVAGDNAVNVDAQPQGRFESVLQFDASAAVSAFNSSLGVGGWTLSSATLQLTEVASPSNPLFNIGIGNFDVLWLSDDDWVEGSGKPTPMEDPPGTIGVGNEMTWDYLATLVAQGSQSNLGSASNTLTDANVVIDLSLTAAFVNDILGGGAVTLHLSPTTPTLGFTCFAAEWPFDPTQRPKLILTADAVPVAHGDLNCDNSINTADISAFVLAMLDPSAYDLTYPGCSPARGDFNSDGLLNGLDVQGFADALTP